jgi:hypothetical protein
METELKIKITFSQLIKGLNQIFGCEHPDIDPTELCLADAEKLEAYAGIIRDTLRKSPGWY